MKKLAILLFGILLFILILDRTTGQFPGYPRKNVFINNYPITLIIANTEERKIKGLSGSTPLTDHQGMLFEFDAPGRYGFWMKDMRYSIDLIYLRDNTIVDVIKDASPSSYPHIFLPKNEFDSTIEITAGGANKMRMQLGDVVVYNE